MVWHGHNGIYGKRVTPAGMQFAPAVTYGGTNFVVVWCEYHNPYYYVYGARLTTSGLVLDSQSIAISPATPNYMSPAVTFDGTDYVVVWEDIRSDTSYDIYGAKVSASGKVLNAFEISTQKEHQFEPALAYSNGDQILIAYSGWTDSINTRPAHTMRIWGKFYPFVGVEGVEHEDILSYYGLHIYPNPFCRKTAINFSTGESIEENDCSIKIYDITGRLVKTFNDLGNLKSRQVVWYGKDNKSRSLPNGVYLCTLETKTKRLTKKIIFLR